MKLTRIFILSFCIALMWLFPLKVHLGGLAVSEADINGKERFDDYITWLYENIGESAIDFNAFHLAVKGYYQLLSEGELKNPNVLTLIDFTRSSNSERFFLIDVECGKLIHRSLVAHGRNTGDEFALHFSNIERSHQSSLGFYVTGEAYDGQQGLSVRLDGMESRFNSNARDRAVVIHGADYVSEDFILNNGRLGRSFGCPALPHDYYEKVVELIKDGSCLFIYYPDERYLANSQFVENENYSKFFDQASLISS